MTDAIEKRVFPKLYDNFMEQSHFFDLMTDLSGDLGPGDTIEIPQHSSVTNSSSTTRAAPEAITPTMTTFSLNQEVFYNVNLPRLLTPQRLNGRWEDQTAKWMAENAKNVMDANLVTLLNLTTAWDTSGTYHVNVAGAALTNTMIQTAIALLESNTGRRRQNFSFLLHPFGAASIASVSGFIPNNAPADAGRVGLPMIGSVSGIPVYISTQVNRQRTVACTAVSISSNVATVTAAGHGLVTGQKVTIAGITTELTTAAAITVASSSSFTVPLTASDGAMADGAGTITLHSTENLLVDTESVYVAKQQAPRLEKVKDFESAASALQLYCSYGRAAETGSCIVLNTPDTTA